MDFYTILLGSGLHDVKRADALVLIHDAAGRGVERRHEHHGIGAVLVQEVMITVIGVHVVAHQLGIGLPRVMHHEIGVDVVERTRLHRHVNDLGIVGAFLHDLAVGERLGDLGADGRTACSARFLDQHGLQAKRARVGGRHHAAVAAADDQVVALKRRLARIGNVDGFDGEVISVCRGCFRCGALG